MVPAIGSHTADTSWMGLQGAHLFYSNHDYQDVGSLGSTRLSCCRQSEHRNGKGKMASRRRTEWNVCHVVFITLTLSLPAWWPFFGMVVAHPRGLFPSISFAALDAPAKLFWEIPLTGLFSNVPGWKSFCLARPSPATPTTNASSFLPHLFTLSCCLPSQSLHLMSNYCSWRNTWRAGSEGRVWNDWVNQSPHKITYCNIM